MTTTTAPRRTLFIFYFRKKGPGQSTPPPSGVTSNTCTCIIENSSSITALLQYTSVYGTVYMIPGSVHRFQRASDQWYARLLPDTWTAWNPPSLRHPCIILSNIIHVSTGKKKTFDRCLLWHINPNFAQNETRRLSCRHQPPHKGRLFILNILAFPRPRPLFGALSTRRRN